LIWGKAVRGQEDQNGNNPASKWKQKGGLKQSPATIEWQAKVRERYFYRTKISPKLNNCNTSI
jgi:hypothetical protein